MGEHYYEILLFHSLSGQGRGPRFVPMTSPPGGAIGYYKLAKGECNNSHEALSSRIRRCKLLKMLLLYDLTWPLDCLDRFFCRISSSAAVCSSNWSAAISKSASSGRRSAGSGASSTLSSCSSVGRSCFSSVFGSAFL